MARDLPDDVRRHAEGSFRTPCSPSTREPLAAVLADAATLAGWQVLDLDDVKQAWTLHETAKAAAREADDAPALAHAMGQQAYVLLDAGASADAVQLVQATKQLTGRRVPPVLGAWLSAAEAEACAALHDDAGSRRALDDAASVLPRGDDLLALPYLALDEAYRALAEMGPTFARARASLECDLA